LHADEGSIVFSTAMAPVMAQKYVCFYANFLQQQSVEKNSLFANVGRVCIILSDIKLHFYYQSFIL
jgi:hypothetical protein